MTRLLTPAILVCLAGTALGQTTTPYSGQEAREISAWSDSQLEDLRAGAGLGYALPAELNGLPGPSHVLELAEELDLDPETIATIEAIFQSMRQRAQALGEALIAVEADLDEAFESGSATADEILRLTAEASEIEGRLRAVHLIAHLETAPLLTGHQRMLYAQARGYSDGHDGQGHGHGDP